MTKNFFFAVLTILTLNSCVSKKIFTELESKYADLKKENRAIADENEALLSAKNKLNTSQTALQKDFDNEGDEDTYLIDISFFVDDAKATHKYTYEKEKNRDDMFENITSEHVQSLVDNAIIMFK